MGRPGMHPLVMNAASGALPQWAEAGPARREHMARVAALLDIWAEARGASADERARWRATGWLHDALRDAPFEALRDELGPAAAGVPGGALHGPVTALRLRVAGVDDEELLEAVSEHTRGGEGLGVLAMALIAADALEPGRPDPEGWRSVLRARAPECLREVAREVLSKRETGPDSAGMR